MTVRNVLIAVALALGALMAPGQSLRAQSAADLFDASVLQRIDIDLHTADWAKLRADFQANTYYPADISWNGMKAYNAGIRSRGVASRSGQKPGLRIAFNHYAAEQSFLGLKSLVLDNLAQDPSGVRETVAMWFLAKFGIPAPREAHAMLFVNGEYAGVYGVVESIDKAMVSRVFGDGVGSQDDGYLYEFNKAAEWGLSYLGAELDAYKPFFSPKTHENSSDETLYRPIETLVRLINQTAPEELASAIGPLIDIEEVVRYAALQNFLAEEDGFAGRWGTNNFYLYRPPHHDRHRLIAWDEDLSLLQPDYDVTSFLDSNALMRKLMAMPDYRSLYFATLREAADAAEAGTDDTHVGALEGEIRRQLDLTDSALQADPVRLSTHEELELARTLMKSFARARVRYVQCEVGRLTGVRPCN